MCSCGVRAMTMVMCRDTGFDGGLLVTSAVGKHSDGATRVGRDRRGGGGGRGISTLDLAIWSTLRPANSWGDLVFDLGCRRAEVGLGGGRWRTTGWRCEFDG